MVAVCLLLRQAVLAVGCWWLRPRCVPRSAFPVLGQPARQSLAQVMGGATARKLCEQHYRARFRRVEDYKPGFQPVLDELFGRANRAGYGPRQLVETLVDLKGGQLERGA